MSSRTRPAPSSPAQRPHAPPRRSRRAASSGVTAPVASREESSRLSTSAVSRSADSSIVAVSSRRSAGGRRRFGSRRLPAAALIDVSGLRRSWPTADSSALRSLGGLGAAPRLLGLRRRAAGCAAPAAPGPPTTSSSRRSAAASVPAGADEVQVVLDRDVDVGVLRAARSPAGPTRRRSATRRPPPLQERHRGEPERLAHLLQQPGQRVGAGEHGAGERGEQRAPPRRARAACWARRAARSTTSATSTATSDHRRRA